MNLINAALEAHRMKAQRIADMRDMYRLAGEAEEHANRLRLRLELHTNLSDLFGTSVQIDDNQTRYDQSQIFYTMGPLEFCQAVECRLVYRHMSKLNVWMTPKTIEDIGEILARYETPAELSVNIAA